jgi:RNA polymerase sigma factor (sigma-70 family)
MSGNHSWQHDQLVVFCFPTRVQGGLMVTLVDGARHTLDPVNRGTRSDDSGLRDVMSAAAAGDPRAWEQLTSRFGSMIMGIARGCRLNDADAGEVHQTTWLRLVENIGRIEHPERVGSWLATTARRECLRLLRKRSRIAFDRDALASLADEDAPAMDAGPLAEERASVVREAYAQLPPRCQRLLGLLSGDDPPSYKEISEMLAMPIGSIGPTRGRCLERLGRVIEEMGVSV